MLDILCKHQLRDNQMLYGTFGEVPNFDYVLSSEQVRPKCMPLFKELLRLRKD